MLTCTQQTVQQVVTFLFFFSLIGCRKVSWDSTWSRQQAHFGAWTQVACRVAYYPYAPQIGGRGLLKVFGVFSTLLEIATGYLILLYFQREYRGAGLSCWWTIIFRSTPYGHSLVRVALSISENGTDWLIPYIMPHWACTQRIRMLGRNQEDQDSQRVLKCFTSREHKMAGPLVGPPNQKQIIKAWNGRLELIWTE